MGQSNETSKPTTGTEGTGASQGGGTDATQSAGESNNAQTNQTCGCGDTTCDFDANQASRLAALEIMFPPAMLEVLAASSVEGRNLHYAQVREASASGKKA